MSQIVTTAAASPCERKTRQIITLMKIPHALKFHPNENDRICHVSFTSPAFQLFNEIYHIFTFQNHLHLKLEKQIKQKTALIKIIYQTEELKLTRA